jgi:hypothetical protein
MKTKMYDTPEPPFRQVDRIHKRRVFIWVEYLAAVILWETVGISAPFQFSIGVSLSCLFEDIESFRSPAHTLKHTPNKAKSGEKAL